MFKNKSIKELQKLILSECQNCIAQYKNELLANFSKLEKTTSEAQFEISKQYRKNYLNLVAKNILEYYKKNSPEIYKRINHIFNSKEKYELLHIDFDSGVAAGHLYCWFYIAITNDNPKPGECIYFNHYQNDLMDKVLAELDCSEIENVSDSDFKAKQGTIIYPDGSKFVGDLLNGKPNGQGTMYCANNDLYIGQIKDGKFNGQGTYKYANGDKYVGGFKDNLSSGHGTMTYANGSIYIGEWKDDKKNGKGTVTTPNGGAYTGEWKGDAMNGNGTFTSTNGVKLVGKWKDGKFLG